MHMLKNSIVQKFIKLSLHKKIALLMAIIIITSSMCIFIPLMRNIKKTNNSKSAMFVMQQVDSISKLLQTNMDQYIKISNTFAEDQRFKAYSFASKTFSTPGLRQEVTGLLSTILDTNQYLNYIGIYKNQDYSFLSVGSDSPLTSDELYNDYASNSIILEDNSTRLSFSYDHLTRNTTLNIYRNMSDPYEAENLIGIFVVNINLTNFLSEYSFTSELAPISINFSDSSGKLLSGEHSQQPSPYAQSLTKLSGFFHYDDLSVAYQQINPYGIFAIAELPTDFFSSASSPLSFPIVIIGLLLIFCISISKRISNSIYRPLAKLNEAMDGFLSCENTSVRIMSMSSGPEMEEVADHFNQIMGSVEVLIKQTREEEHRSEEVWRSVYMCQIKPLLWESVSYIHKQAITDGNDKISLMAEAIADYYRLFLFQENDVIILSQDLEHIKNYLALQEICRGIHVNLDISVDEHLLKTPIPKMTLQPLIENSILHGIDSIKNTSVNISIRANQRYEDIYVTISDNGTGMSQEEIDKMNHSISCYEKGIDYGARDVHRRIESLFGKGFGLFYKLNQTGGVSVLIHLPSVSVSKKHL